MRSIIPRFLMNIIPENIPLDIIYEDDHLLVVNKPAGMIVHPGAGVRNGTLVNALLYHCKDLSNISGRLRPGIVHRLDKLTSGLLVVAKDDISHRNLQKQFSEKLGITQSMLSRLEKGYSEPPLRLLIKLSEVSGKSIDELVKGSE